MFDKSIIELVKYLKEKDIALSYDYCKLKNGKYKTVAWIFPDKDAYFVDCDNGKIKIYANDMNDHKFICDFFLTDKIEDCIVDLVKIVSDNSYPWYYYRQITGD